MSNEPLSPLSAASPLAITGEHWIESLRDGSHVLIRPLRKEDREREYRFLQRLSPMSRHFRFLAEVKAASPALLDQLMDVDDDERCALIALVHDNGELREVGVARYSDAGQAGCEFAVTVADDWRERGLATTLMRHLIDRARRAGFRTMYSIDSSSNECMRDLAAFLGFKRSPDPDDSRQVIHTLQL